jgi:hypothetical protein
MSLDRNETAQVRRIVEGMLRNFTGGGGGGLTAPVSAADIADGSVSNTEYQYLNGVTSAIQTQIDGKASVSSILAAQALRA